MRRVLALAILTACVVPATANAREVDTDKPVVLFAGSQYENVNCKVVYGAMESKLKNMTIKIAGAERKFKKIVTLSPQAGKSTCDESLPDGLGSTEEIARRFADWLSKTYGGKPVDVVAEGTSGVVLRYAIGMGGKDGWPKLNVEDAVTLGSPHGGSDKFAGKCRQAEVCADMNKTDGSPLWTKLAQPAFQHPGATDWSAIGSVGNDLTEPKSAIAMDADHKTTFKATLSQQALLNDTEDKRDAQIDYQHRGEQLKTWNKAPHAAERTGLEIVYGPERDAAADRCENTVAEWKLAFDCGGAGDVTDGARNVSVTTPSGLQTQIPSVPRVPFPFPLKDDQSLALPISLPNLNVTAGGLKLSAYENSIDKEGLTIGSGALQVGRFGTALVEDLTIGTDGSIAASSLELDAFGGQIVAEKVKFGRENGLSADEATLYLPEALGGTELRFIKLGIDAKGRVFGTLKGGKLKIGDITAEVDDVEVDGNVLVIGSARLQLPKYLGGADLQAKALRWDGKKMSGTFNGALNFALAGGKLKVGAEVGLTLDGSGGYQISGAGTVVVPGIGGGAPFFEASADITVKSINCRPKPGPCPNPVLLQQASLSIKTGKPLPLGQTGLALTGLSGSVKASKSAAYMDPDGTIHGVVYTFGVGARIASYPNDSVFQGDIDGFLSTNLNFGMSLTNAKVFKFIKLEGGACIVLDSVASDSVCEKPLKEDRSKVAGPGAYVRGRATAGLSYANAAASVSASIDGSAFGRYVQSGNESYVDAELKGKIQASASVSAPLLPTWVFQGEGTVNARLGRFKAPTGGEVVGMKAMLSAQLRAGGPDSRTFTLERAIFADVNGNYTQENVNAYSAVSPPTPNPMRSTTASRQALLDGHAFELAPRQTGTMIVVAAKQGSPSLELTTPRGTRVTVPSPGSVRLEDGARPAEKRDTANVYSVRTRAPHTLSVYLPDAQPGRWVARVEGVDLGGYRLEVDGNKPLPRLAVTRPGGRGVTATRRRRAVALQGTLRGAAGGATLSLYAGRGRCETRQGKPIRPGAAVELATGVPVRRGSWRRRWNTRNLPAGRYSVYAELDNGTAPQVVACSKGAVRIEGKKRRKPARGRRERSQPTRARAARRDAGPAASVSLPMFVVPHHRPKGGNKCATYGVPMKMPKSPEMIKVPVFKISGGPDKLPLKDVAEVARNMAAGINGRDPTVRNNPPVPNGKARTAKYVDRKPGDAGYEPYKYDLKEPGSTAPDTLHYWKYSPKTNCQKTRPLHYGQTCRNTRPFVTKPGPPDKKEKWTCDEYPFASTFEGGRDEDFAAIVRAVPSDENSEQGRRFNDFLIKWGVKLQRLHGEFDVCVEEPRAGDNCDGNRTAPAWEREGEVPEAGEK